MDPLASSSNINSNNNSNNILRSAGQLDNDTEPAMVPTSSSSSTEYMSLRTRPASFAPSSRWYQQSSDIQQPYEYGGLLLDGDRNAGHARLGSRQAASPVVGAANDSPKPNIGQSDHLSRPALDVALNTTTRNYTAPSASPKNRQTESQSQPQSQFGGVNVATPGPPPHSTRDAFASTSSAIKGRRARSAERERPSSASSSNYTFRRNGHTPFPPADGADRSGQSSPIAQTYAQADASRGRDAATSALNRTYARTGQTNESNTSPADGSSGRTLADDRSTHAIPTIRTEGVLSPTKKPRSNQPGQLSSRSKQSQRCAKCCQPMTGQFVRALGTVFHLDCFRCQDCNKVVAAKFFPIEGAEGRQYPLCETDYFRRLSLICAKCGAALRGSYITALDMKFHIEHFTCSVCPTVFGPQDSYYEHSGQVYCHFHYSTRFAVKCTGCKTAILKQFVEINRNNVDEHWHPECYMIHKFWNIKLVPSKKTLASVPPDNTEAEFAGITGSSSATEETPVLSPAASTPLTPDFASQEQSETAQTLKDKQKHVEGQVYRIWTVLSTFEESSAACISEMLRHVSNSHYLDGVRLADKFILHVETLFSSMDDLNVTFRHLGGKEIVHVREARMLCKKIVNFFSLLSHTHESGVRKMGITQDLLSLVTGLAHYLKILIRIALTAALRLEREHASQAALTQFLNRLDRLCKDLDSLKSPLSATTGTSPVGPHTDEKQYGYRSLARRSGTFLGQGESLSDLCERCRLTVEEECIRLSPNRRWHLACLCCSVCQRPAVKDEALGADPSVVPLRELRFSNGPDPSSDQASTGRQEYVVCESCTVEAGLQDGFLLVTRLEQYAFLLCVALNKLYRLLKQRGVVPASPTALSNALSSEEGERSLHEAYRNSMDIKRMKTVNLDRKLTATAKVAQRLTIVDGPSSKTAATMSSELGKPEPSIRPVYQQPSPVASMPVQGQPDTQQWQTGHESNSDYLSRPPSRPSATRSTTAVRIIADHGLSDSRNQPGSGAFGSNTSLANDEVGITLADLQHVIQAEQARAEHRSLPSAGSTQLLSELSALEYLIVKHAAAITLASDLSPFREYADMDDLLDIIDAKKNNFWGKLFKGGGKDKKDIKKKTGVFGVPLEILVERHGADSMLGAGPGSLRIPVFIDDAITAMRQMDMSVEGVFRKNGNIKRLRELADAIDRDPDSVNLQDDNPVQVAALLKKFLRDLPDPLLTFRLQHLWLATQKIDDEADRQKVMHLVCCLMPKCHRDTMEVLFVFLRWVASFAHVDEETGSKMDLQNLATVICPNVLYAKGKDATKDESFLGIRAIVELMAWQDLMFTVPTELLAILGDQELLSNPAELSSKDIIRKAELYLRERNQYRYPPHMGEAAHGNGYRGEVKQTHPHYHAGFAQPPTQYFPTMQPGSQAPPLLTGSLMPVNSPALPSPHQRSPLWAPGPSNQQ